MTDKAIRSAKLTAAGLLDKARARTAVTRAGGQIAPSKYLPNVPRQVHADGGRENGSEGIVAAEAVAKMLREGRAKEVTNDHLDAADPQHLFKLYEAGKTGMDLPMDKASRMERANAMGFGQKVYHGGNRDLQKLNKFDGSAEGGAGTFYSTDDPHVANTYANKQFGVSGQNVAPLLANTKGYIEKGFTKPFPENGTDAEQMAWVNENEKWNRSLDYSKTPYFENVVASARLKNAPGAVIRQVEDNKTSGQFDTPSDIHVTLNPTNIRSQFARFDPRLAHLSHLSAATGGRIGYTDGGNVDDPQPAAPPPADLGQAREQKQLRTFHTGLMGDIKSSVSAMQMAHQKALDAGVFDGYEVGDVLQGSAHPMRITGRYVQKWKPTPSMLQSFDRMKAKPTIIEHEGQQYIPMLRYQTGKEDVDGFQEGSAYLDGVKAAGYRKMGGLRSVKADGGRIHANKGGKMGARADFIAGNHPEVPSVVYHSTKADFHEFRPLSHFGTAKAAHDRHHAGTWNTGRVIDATDKVSVMPAHISLKNPLDVGTERDWADNPQMIRQAADTMFKSGMIDPDYLKAAEKLYDLSYDRDLVSDPREFDRQAAQALREAGHDGIIYTNRIEDPGSRSFVTLGPEQVKSSIGNQGTFDPTNPNMTKAGGGEVDGIDAFHSSPHDFDEFDIAHLGTGEGAQAYGHGLYFSANPKVSDRGGQYWNQFMNKMKSGAERSAAATLKGQKWDRDAAVSQLRSNAEYHEDRGSGRYGDGSDVEEGHRLLAQEYRDAADHIASGKIAGPRTYRVKLNIKPHELIDWDKPLSEQHPNVQAVLGTGSETAGSKLGRANNNPMHAGDIVGKDRATRQELSEHLLSKGIKGIRYLDAGSRDLSDGDPTYNYVTFNHDPVKVVDKYEYGGMVKKSGGGPMGDDDQPVDLGVARAMRRFNQTDDSPPPEVEGIFNRLATAKDAAADAHETAQKAGAFDNVQIGDVLKYKLHSGYAPMKVIGHGMVPVNRWGGINPPKYVYKDHFPVAHVEYQDASKERASPAIELLEDRDRYDFLSGRPRAVRKRGGAVDAALTATRRFTKDGKAATMALKPKGK